MSKKTRNGLSINIQSNNRTVEGFGKFWQTCIFPYPYIYCVYIFIWANEQNNNNNIKSCGLFFLLFIHSSFVLIRHCFVGIFLFLVKSNIKRNIFKFTSSVHSDTLRNIYINKASETENKYDFSFYFFSSSLYFVLFRMANYMHLFINSNSNNLERFINLLHGNEVLFEPSSL